MRINELSLSFTGLLLFFVCGSIAQASSLSLSSAVVNPGGTATLGVALTVSGTAPAGLEWTMAYSPSQISAISITPGPAATAAVKTLSCASGSGVATCILTGMNTDAIGSGVVAYLNATVAPGTTTTSIQISSLDGTDSNGNGLSVTSAGNGTITSPSLLTVACTPTALSAAAISSCTVTLSQTAPTGGSSVTLASNNTLLTVPTSLTVAAGATTATFSAAAAASITSNQSATVTATFNNSSKTATISLLTPVSVSTVACSPTSLGQSAVSTCTVALAQTAPTGGSSVTLASNNVSLTVPASVTVASGSTTATFSATAAAAIASNQSASVTATLGSSSQTATISLLAPVLVSGVACSPTSLRQSAASTCTVTLTQSAPTGGSSVTLASNNASLAVPASMTVASGATTATFRATAAATIASNQTVTVTATLGNSSQSATISLLAPVLVSGVACSPTSLGQSAVSTCTVTLTQKAPAGGSTVTLTSNDTSLTVSASVTVASGVRTATFSATAAASIASNQSATVTATLGSSSKTATISLLAQVLISGVTCTPTSLGQSAVSTCTVTLTQKAPAGGSTVTLASNNTSLTVPASLTVASGSATVTFSATAAATIAGNQTVTVTATLGSSSQTATISLLAPVLVSAVACSPTNLGQSAVSTCTVTLTQTAPAGGSSVTLASNNASLTVPASITVAAGATTATFSATAAASIASNQSATVTATLGSSSQTTVMNLVASTATFINTDSTTSGNWISVYGTDGYNVVGDLSSNPSYVTPAVSGQQYYVWAASTADVPALQMASNPANRVAATWYGSSFTIDLNITDSAQHQVALYSVDFDAQGRKQTVAVLDTNGNVLDSRALSNFSGGVYLVWNVTGHVKLLVTSTAGPNAVVSGLFLGPGVSPGLVSGVACSPASLSQSSTSTCTVTLTQTAPAGGWGIALTSNNTALTVPASVTVAAGATTASFSATAAASIASNQSATVTASLGTSLQTATVSLLAPAPILVSGVACSPTSLRQYAASTCTVTLTQAAPKGGSSVTLSSNNTSFIVPPSVSVTAGATTSSFNAVTGSFKTGQTATLTASLNGSVATALLTLIGSSGAQSAPAKSMSRPAGEGETDQSTPSSSSPGNNVSSMLCSPRVLTAGGAVTCELLVTASAQSVPVALSSSSEQVLIPAVVTTRPNQSSLTFQAQSNPVSKQQPVTIKATLGTTEVEDTILLMAPSGPVLRVPKSQTAKAGAPTSFKVKAVDPSDLPLQLEGAKTPSGASFDPLTGVFEWIPQASQAGKYRIAFTATNSARQSSSAQVELEVDSGLTTLNTPAPSCSPGAIATLTGKWLAAPGSQFSDPTGASFDLDGSSVTVNGKAVPVLYSSANRVDFLCPAAGTGPQLSVEVTSAFGSSQPVTVGVVEAVPTILSMDDSPQNQALISFSGTNDLVMERNFRVASHPAQPGDQIAILATGLGSAADSSSRTMLVKVSDVYAGIESVHPVPGSAGVYAIQVRVPAAMTFGAVPVQLQMMTLDGHELKSNAVTAAFEAVRQ